jgi:hypothetical protein
MHSKLEDAPRPEEMGQADKPVGHCSLPEFWDFTLLRANPLAWGVLLQEVSEAV